MKTFTSIKALDGFSNKIKPISSGIWEYEKDSYNLNRSYISKPSLEGLLLFLSESTFGILSPYKPDGGQKSHMEKLAAFRKLAQDAKIQIFHIVGRWQEKDISTYKIDKGYVLIKPEQMAIDAFIGFMQQHAKNYGVPSFVFKRSGEELSCLNQEGDVTQEFTEELSLDLLAKAYSSCFPTGRSFSFIGLEVPNGSLISFQLYKGSGINYYLPEYFFRRN